MLRTVLQEDSKKKGEAEPKYDQGGPNDVRLEWNREPLAGLVPGGHRMLALGHAVLWKAK